MMSTEQVLVVTKTGIEDMMVPYWRNSGPALWEFLSIRAPRFVPREQAETDESMLQLVPYVVVAEEGTNPVMEIHPTGRILAYQRTKQGGEGRLHNSWSVGVGGHVNPCDQEPGDFIVHPKDWLHLAVFNAAARELNEEFGIGCADLQFRGLLYSDDSPVSRVHLGIVGVTFVPELPKAREEAIGRVTWLCAGDGHGENLKTFLQGKVESWSDILMQRMDDVLP